MARAEVACVRVAKRTSKRPRTTRSVRRNEGCGDATNIFTLQVPPSPCVTCGACIDESDTSIGGNNVFERDRGVQQMNQTRCC